jgi:hypothetical protein
MSRTMNYALRVVLTLTTPLWLVPLVAVMTVLFAGIMAVRLTLLIYWMIWR